MKLTRYIKCRMKQVNHQCNQRNIKYELIRRDVHLRNFEILEQREKECNDFLASSKTLEHITSCDFSISLVSMPSLTSVEFEGMNDCEHNPINCNETYNELKTQNKGLYLKIEDKKRSLERLCDIVADIKRLYNYRSNNENVKIFPRFDSNDQLVIVSFDLEGFDPAYHTPAIYLSFGYTNSQNSRMYINYEGANGSINILDFYSMKERRNHGSIMLQVLLEIVPELNGVIYQYNTKLYKEIKMTKENFTYEQFKESFWSYRKKINRIEGSIYPSGSYTKESLTHFYEKNGFVKDGLLYREV